LVGDGWAGGSAGWACKEIGMVGLEVNAWTLPLGAFHPGEDKGMFSKVAVAMEMVFTCTARVHAKQNKNNPMHLICCKSNADQPALQA
jgi:hypothetical protein